MRYEVLKNKIVRLPLEKGIALVDDYNNKYGFKNFAEQQGILNLMDYKHATVLGLDDEDQLLLTLFLTCLAMGRKKEANQYLDYISLIPSDSFNVCLSQIMIGFSEEDILNILKNGKDILPPVVVETCIINLDDKSQVSAICKYKEYLDPKCDTFITFYFSVCEDAKLKLKEFFSRYIGDDIFLVLEDLDEDSLIKKLSSDRDRIWKIPSDELVKFMLLKATKYETLETFMKLYSDKIKECSNERFILFFTRYKYIKGRYLFGYDNNEDDEKLELSVNMNFFDLFKDKFHEIGVNDTLGMFDLETDSDAINYFSVYVILELLDIAFDDIKSSKYLNENTIKEIMRRFEEKCMFNEYSLSDFERLVSNLGKGGKTKLIHDDYIEAIIACRKLLSNNTINNKHPLFLELRNKFTNYLTNRCMKDGTYTNNISLNGIFYRVVKGSIPFNNIFNVKTYRGLIYLSKSGELIDNVDYITKLLSDEQVAKMNISPVIKWNKSLKRENNSSDSLAFIERMGLQLLCYFGVERAKYLLESNIQGNRMENIFDGLNYKSVSINDDGTPNVNDELLNYLFSRRLRKEPNSIINKMIRGEIPKFEKYFKEFCNKYETVKDSCKGILSIKRIVRHFENVPLPIKLKPDEIEFTSALRELNTTNVKTLNKAIELCKAARDRNYSTIPKVEGKIGDFTYKVLDLKNPMAVAEGYLSHCCFTIEGLSSSSLEHSMRSKNGRAFEVYYKGKYLGQSWIWRNGDVICFDSVEAGNPVHEIYKDDINLVDVYKQAAEQMLEISEQTEDEVQRVKVVTVGKSDYLFTGLKMVDGHAPKPLEDNLYIYDSREQKILAGDMPKKPRYGDVDVQFKDSRKKPIIINNILNTDIDTLDTICIGINSLRYRIYGYEEPIDFLNYTKAILGDGWYILVNNAGIIESGTLEDDSDTILEYNNYLSKMEFPKGKTYLKKERPKKGNEG